VHGRDQSADGELPLEAEPKVDQDHQETEHDGDDRLLDQFLRHARADHLDTADGVVLAEGRAHPIDDAAGPLTLFRGADLDQELRVGAEFLDLHLADIKSPDRLADIADVGRSRGRLHLDEGAALEVNADIEAEGQKSDDADDREERRERKAPMPMPHEGNVEGFRDVVDEGHERIALAKSGWRPGGVSAPMSR
jgi:hypothetical protein